MRYFIADTHLDNEILFPSRQEFNKETWAELIIDLVNSKVKPFDMIYFLGDFAHYPEKIKYKFKCKNTFLIHGNHDPNIEKCKLVFGKDQVFQNKEIAFYESTLWLSHYPHLAWPKSHYGAYHIYGHVHDQRSLFWENIFPEIRSLDVSPEAYKRIFGEWGIWSQEQIYDILSVRKGHDDVSFYREQWGQYGTIQSKSV